MPNPNLSVHSNSLVVEYMPYGKKFQNSHALTNQLMHVHDIEMHMNNIIEYKVKAETYRVTSRKVNILHDFDTKTAIEYREHVMLIPNALLNVTEY